MKLYTYTNTFGLRLPDRAGPFCKTLTFHYNDYWVKNYFTIMYSPINPVSISMTSGNVL